LAQTNRTVKRIVCCHKKACHLVWQNAEDVFGLQKSTIRRFLARDIEFEKQPQLTLK